MKTIEMTKSVWVVAVIAVLMLAGQNAVAATAGAGVPEDSAVTPPTVTGGDSDQIDNADHVADIRAPQVVDPDVHDVDVPDVESPDVQVPDVETPDVHMPDVEVPEAN